MPIHGYPGNVITANPTAPTVSSASGVWTTEQQLLAVSQGNWPGYEYPISRSLRFNSADSAYLNRTPGSAGNRKTWTWSGWLKRGILNSSAGAAYPLFAVPTGTTDSTWFELRFISDFLYIAGYSTNWRITSQVFRDPSAWYHIVLSVDTTQATANDRLKLYVNGTQVTTFSTTNNPTQNADLGVNQAAATYIGFSNTQYFDGYLTEINFIDGQALTPSSFGLNDPETGVWSPKRYTGTYGTNGFYLPFSDNSTALTGNALTYSEDFGNASWTKYQSTVTTDVITAPNGTTTADKLIETATSGDHQVSKTFSATDNTTYTLSTYAKAGERSTFRLYVQKKDGATYSYVDFELSNGTKGTEYAGATGTITNVGNGWYRCTLSVNVGTGATASPLAILSYATISTGSGTNGLYIWGAQLETASSVGPYFATVASTITNAYRIGADQSLPTGGYNSWVTNNFSVTAGAGNDSLVDSPTSYGTDTGAGGEVRGNYCTFNSVETNYGTLSNGNLNASLAVTGTTGRQARGTFLFPTSGKYYFEVSPTTLGVAGQIGIAKFSSATNGGNGITPAFSAGDVYLYLSNGQKQDGVTSSAYGASYTTTNTIGVAVDVDNSTLTFYKDGVSQGTAYSSLTLRNYYPVVHAAGSTGTFTSDINFGQRPFAYTAPSGFKALCTQNLPTPTIGATSTTQANDYFDATLYTGNGTGITVTNAGSMQPDFVWMKNRSNVADHALYDVLRTAMLSSNTTAAEVAASNVVSYNSNGFTINGGDSRLNANGNTYVGWQWKANGAGSSNTAGTITSTVSANTTSGFSIVTYTGNNTASTVGHGLGVAPRMVIVKLRSTTGAWGVYHGSLTAGQVLYLNLTDAVDSSAIWNSTAPTSTVFSVGAHPTSNPSGQTLVAYCFAPVAGYSAFGSYTGNGSTDGPFVYTGMRPAFILWKRSDGAESWWINDTDRLGYNGDNRALFPNASSTENTANNIDILSNGFKIRGSGGEVNASGGTYIYACFAENPFKYSLAR